MLLQKLKDKVAGHIRENPILYLAVLFFFAIGLAAGIYTIAQFPEARFNQVGEYLNSFFAVLKTEQPDIGAILLQSLCNNFKLICFIAFCGFSLYCIPITLLLMSVKGFMVGFTLTAMILQFGFLGFLVCLLCIIPPNVISVYCYLRLGVDSALNGIYNHQQRKYVKRPRFDRPYINQVAGISAFCLLGVVIESIMAPFVLRIFVGAITI